MENKKSFADRVSAFFSAFWQKVKRSFKEAFSKENVKKVKTNVLSALKHAFDKKFFKTCFILLAIGIAFVGFWLAFTYSTRLGWWLIALTVIWLICYAIADFLIWDPRALFASAGLIGFMALFSICYFIGNGLGGEDTPEMTALFGFASLIVALIILGIVVLILLGLYEGVYNRHKDPNKTLPKFVLWLFKWTIVLAAIADLCWFLITKLVPLIH